VPIDYLMEGPAEAARLEAKTDARLTRRLLRLTRLSKGARALDAGAGTGAVAREMVRLVGPTGAVVALDGSIDRLSEGRRLALESSPVPVSFLVGDLRHVPMRSESLDYVWCRFVFEYLSDPAEVFDELLRLVKPGGKLVIGDLDGNGIFHHPFPEDLSEAMKRLEAGLRGRFDPSMGRKLYRFFWERKLGNIRTHLFPYNVYAGRASTAAIANWDQKLEVLKPIGEKIFGTFPYSQFRSRFLDFLSREDTLSYSVLFLAELIIGVIIPIILFSSKKVRMSRRGSLIAALFVIAGIVLNRFDTSWFAMQPVGSAHYSPSWMEVAILVGVAAGVLLVFTIISRFFPVFKETVPVTPREAQPAEIDQPASTAPVPVAARTEGA